MCFDTDLNLSHNQMKNQTTVLYFFFFFGLQTIWMEAVGKKVFNETDAQQLHVRRQMS